MVKEKMSSDSEKENSKMDSVKPLSEEVKNSTKVKVVVAQGGNLEIRDEYRFEVLDARELPEERIEEIADYFRYAFNNSFPEYAVCTDCDVVVSSKEVFGVGKKDYVSLEELDDESNLPECNDCGKKMKFFHDKEMTVRKLKEKFSMDCKIILMLSTDTNDIKGMTFGYYDSLKGVIEREWGHPYNYMKEEDQKESLKFDVEGTVEKVILAEGTTGEEVFCWNCIILDRSASKYLRTLTGMYFRVHKEGGKLKMPVISQVLDEKMVKRWMIRGGFHEIDEIFPKEYAFLFGDFEEVCYGYLR